MTLRDVVAPFVAAAWLAALPFGAPAAAAVAPGATATAAVSPAADIGPQELMDDVARRMFDALDANRTATRKNAEKVYPLVEQILLPHFDTEYAAQLVLAQNWRTATAEQRTHFVSALYGALLRTYGAAISDFTADRLKLLPYRGEEPATATQATVRTLVRRSSGVEVPVDYRMHRTPARCSNAAAPCSARTRTSRSICPRSRMSTAPGSPCCSCGSSARGAAAGSCVTAASRRSCAE